LGPIEPISPISAGCEVVDGINVDTAKDGKITGIEILSASKKIDLQTILSYSIDVNKNLHPV